MDSLQLLKDRQQTLPSLNPKEKVSHEIASHFFFKKLMYFIAAEINNPLAVIGSHVHDMQSSIEKDKGTADSLLAGLKRISSSSDKITKLFKHLKNISETGGVRAPVQSVFLKQIVSEVLELCHGRILQHQIQVFEAIDPRVIVNVRPQEIMQIFMHLIENSIQANSQRTDGWIRIEAIAQGNLAVITVNDSGPGLKSWNFEQALSPVAYQNKDAFRGLPISAFLAKENNGLLGLVANEAGSKFVLRLPIAQ